MYGYIVRNIMNTLLQSGIHINSNKCKYFTAKGMLIMTEAGILEIILKVLSEEHGYSTRGQKTCTVLHGILVFFIKVCSIYHVNCKALESHLPNLINTAL